MISNPRHDPCRPAISAHRGGVESGRAQTSDAFAAAIRFGVEYVELDVRRCADGRLVTHHDERVTGGGPRISEVSYPELVAVAGFEVPLLRDVLRLVTPHAIAQLDLKVPDAADVVGEALGVCGPEQLMISSVTETTLAEVRAIEPKVATVLSLGQRIRGGLGRRSRPDAREDCSVRRIVGAGCDAIALNHRLVTGTLLRRCAAAGILVMLWTVNDPRRLAQLLGDARVGVVITDFPRAAMAIRDRAFTR
jgi:glycerophosphoryl diester phosphodiesterase